MKVEATSKMIQTPAVRYTFGFGIVILGGSLAKIILTKSSFMQNSLLLFVGLMMILLGIIDVFVKQQWLRWAFRAAFAVLILGAIWMNLQLHV